MNASDFFGGFRRSLRSRTGYSGFSRRVIWSKTESAFLGRKRDKKRAARQFSGCSEAEAEAYAYTPADFESRALFALHLLTLRF